MNDLAERVAANADVAVRLLKRWRHNRDELSGPSGEVAQDGTFEFPSFLRGRLAAQRTLRRTVHCAGIGLHSGRKVSLSLKPAPPGHGIRFQRADLKDVAIPAHVSHLRDRQHLQTGLVRDRASVETIEHLLAALRGLGIDNVLVELNQAEVPIMDGSSAPWVYLIQDAGVKELNAPRKTIQILRPIHLQDGDKRIALYPSERFKISYTISFDHPLLRFQQKTLDIDEQTFIDQIAPARTFGFLKEVEMLRQRGLALGGSLENAIILGETGVLNPLRFDDEFVRHKMLDVMGDLALVGHPIQGHVVVHRGGHALHTALAIELLKQTDVWTFVGAPEKDAPARVRVPASQPLAN
jgi:UDP-3-O-[3-hydroxymyristoyl] N-acetylglucosamine deacetylase